MQIRFQIPKIDSLRIDGDYSTTTIGKYYGKLSNHANKLVLSGCKFTKQEFDSFVDEIEEKVFCYFIVVCSRTILCLVYLGDIEMDHCWVAIFGWIDPSHVPHRWNIVSHGWWFLLNNIH